MISNIALLAWQVKEVCKAFPGRIIDVHAGYHITNGQKYREFKDKLLELEHRLYIDYDEKHNYHEGHCSYDPEDCRIRVCTVPIIRPASDFPGGSETRNGTDNVLTFIARYAEYALTKHYSNYVVNVNNMEDSKIETNIREYGILTQITYPLKDFSICTKQDDTTLKTHTHVDGASTTVHISTTHTSAPVYYKAKYTDNELILLINDTSSLRHI